MIRRAQWSATHLLWLMLAFSVGCSSPARSPHPPMEPIDRDFIDHRLVLVGDAGDADGSRVLLQKVGLVVDEVRDRTTLVFLGDNFYPRGSVNFEDKNSARVLAQQLNAGTSRAKTVFVPGNHDWDDTAFRKFDVPAGLARLDAMKTYVESRPRKRGVWLPSPGCPGPEILDLPMGDQATVRLLLLDSEWWLLKEEQRNQIARDQQCSATSGEDVVTKIRDALACDDDEISCPPRIIVAHHPIETHGAHGGYFPVWEHFFCFGRVPLPGFCSLVIGARVLGFFSQDTASERYGKYVNAMSKAMKAAPPLAFVAGHDHSLQVIRPDTRPTLLVSGSGAMRTPVSDAPDFNASRLGFMVLDFMKNTSVILRVFEDWEGPVPAEAYRTEIQGAQP